MPNGPIGSWSLRFVDEFSGEQLDTDRWVALAGYHTNGVTTDPANVSVAGGCLILQLASASHGAEISSAPYDGAGKLGYVLPVGGYAEARVCFPGTGARVFNWPAWWTSGPDWPHAGEHDIAEGLGALTVNYHSNSGAHNHGIVAGEWANQFHCYGLHRGPDTCEVYYDGQLVRRYKTSDNGEPHALLLNVGAGEEARYGAESMVRVDYVRAWEPASGG